MWDEGKREVVGKVSGEEQNWVIVWTGRGVMRGVGNLNWGASKERVN